MRCTFSPLGVGLVLTLTSAALVAGEPAKPTQHRITVDEIQKSVVIGRLGVPLGDVVTVKMRWSSVRSKPSDTAFVSDVDGRPLDRPARFWHDMPRTPNSNSGIGEPRFELERDYEFRAYETIGFVGMRDEWRKETDGPLVASIGYGFSPELKLLREAPAEQSKPRSQPDWRETKSRITVDEIQDAVVIGKLGVPLGDVATLRCHWDTEGLAKPGDRIVVTEVNGQRLDPQVVFEALMPWSKDSKTGSSVRTFEYERDYLVRAYETAGFEGGRDEWRKETGGPPVQIRGYHFRSRIEFLRDASGNRRRARTAPVPSQK